MATVAVTGGLTGCKVHRKFCGCLLATLGLMLVAVITEAKAYWDPYCATGCRYRCREKLGRRNKKDQASEDIHK